MNNDLDGFGKLLDKTWKHKRSLSTLVSNSIIDSMYQEAIDNGALGGKLSGAGGGWILHPIDGYTTELTYMWNGELLGKFPDWALTRAWVEQGNEVMTWIQEALQK